ncbi:MAG: hypothetical protein D8M57_11610 [Candidatus Scalindua sp. AMX11]|nr:hypothetical protein [Planctomycetota bacterium]RZV73168.1 MAG: hypothetical protein EX341_13595 [Candidatus Scalindua sp. SCAELEC01]TDE64743.1 MAG: hypothetical protein D8M57_11610 [Candidatus Scalindua sp. AMX11]
MQKNLSVFVSISSGIKNCLYLLLAAVENYNPFDGGWLGDIWELFFFLAAFGTNIVIMTSGLNLFEC